MSAVLISIFTLFFVISGCQSTPTARPVPIKNRILLKDGGPHQGTWSEKQMTFQYSYTLSGTQLSLSGTINARTSRRFVVTEMFNLKVYFVNEEGTSIGVNTIATPRTRSRSMRRSINRNIEVPPNAKYIAFGVNARFRDDDVSLDIFITPFE